MDKEMKKAVEMLKLCVWTLEEYSGNENVYGPKDASMRILEIKAFIWDQETFASFNDATAHISTVGYSRDITAYSADGSRCVEVYDNMGGSGAGYIYLVIASTLVDGRWTLGKELEHNLADGIDAMTTANAFLSFKGIEK